MLCCSRVRGQVQGQIKGQAVNMQHHMTHVSTRKHKRGLRLRMLGSARHRRVNGILDRSVRRSGIGEGCYAQLMMNQCSRQHPDWVGFHTLDSTPITKPRTKAAAEKAAWHAAWRQGAIFFEVLSLTRVL